MGHATTTYPDKYYALLTTTIGSSTLATSTDYIFSGSQLLGTIEGGTYATTTRYMHSDNLGSTDAVTNASGTPVQILDYYPYGSSRIASSTAGTDEKRKFIGQFTDSSGLSYLNARYYSPTQGQFLSEDPAFLGNPKQQGLGNPQNLNSYSYSVDNPITKSDPTGLWYKEFITGQQSWPSFQLELGGAANELSQENPLRVLPPCRGRWRRWCSIYPSVVVR